jgi:hypothetical protein
MEMMVGTERTTGLGGDSGERKRLGENKKGRVKMRTARETTVRHETKPDQRLNRTCSRWMKPASQQAAMEIASSRH